ncbi:MULTISPECIES: hypothetical protein [Sinorhizobium]|uniref:Uncharacterized protein n=1 Tax=Sinorhizobium meliloti (strain SM11) TaxID=707241 RepID=A4KVG3_SINMM|nr:MULTISPECIES: hypothetical protein [Sinorhizobium]ABN47064.1 hypothetical protein [Sinorhizobium meliloti SM11]MDE4561836.1 hypothetical protein [Sinorhizobium meliloti SM11]WQP09062.1 hypothetical protein U8C39_33580 [Sinorhizobium meliloti]WQP22557.1 hypothetical protein U8C33_34255 [Sinorhizobium meliloti]WQP35904.1 hypothetical protein U8C45_33545 [Sinorhizobium meliloti]
MSENVLDRIDPGTATGKKGAILRKVTFEYAYRAFRVSMTDHPNTSVIEARKPTAATGVAQRHKAPDLCTRIFV